MKAIWIDEGYLILVAIVVISWLSGYVTAFILDLKTAKRKIEILKEIDRQTMPLTEMIVKWKLVVPQMERIKATKLIAYTDDARTMRRIYKTDKGEFSIHYKEIQQATWTRDKRDNIGEG